MLRTENTFLFPPAVQDGLFVMATLAERLPVGLVPEESGIAFVRRDVVHDCRGFQDSQGIAFGAERVSPEKFLPCRAPTGAITTCSRGSSQLIQFAPLLYAMLLASAVSGIDKCGTSWVTARMFRSKRTHLVCLALTGDVIIRCLRASLGCSFIGGLPFSMT
jgi:hypothetical protein